MLSHLLTPLLALTLTKTVRNISPRSFQILAHFQGQIYSSVRFAYFCLYALDVNESFIPIIVVYRRIIIN